MRLLLILDYSLRTQSSFDAFLRQLMRELRAEGHELTVAVPVAPPPEWQAELAALGIPLAVLPGWREIPELARSRRHNLRGLRQLTQAVDLGVFDLIAVHHCNHFFSFALGACLRWTRKPARLVIHQHNEVIVHHDPIRHVLTGYLSKLRLATRFADAVTTVYRGGAENLVRKHVPAWKVSWIYNGVPVERFDLAAPGPDVRRELGIADGRRIVLYVGRLQREKGVFELLAAFERLLAHVPSAVLVLVGDGPLYDARERVTSRRIADSVRWTGRRQDVPALLAVADFLVLPSYRESFGLAAAEAGAAGKAVVVSSVGGLPELVRNGIDGLTVPRQDVAALAIAMQRLLENPSECRAMGGEFRRRVREDFTLDAMVSGYARLYPAVCRLGAVKPVPAEILRERTCVFFIDYHFKAQSSLDRFFLEFGTRLRAGGNRVRFVLPVKPIDDLRESLEGAGIEVLVLDRWRTVPENSKSRRRVLSTAARAFREAHLRDTDLICFFFCDPAFAGVVAARQRLLSAHTTLVFHQRNEVRFPGGGIRSPLSRHLSRLRLVSPLLDGIVAVYGEGRRNLISKGVPEWKAFYVSNGTVAEERAAGSPPSYHQEFGVPASWRIVLFVGQVTREKGVRELLYAMPDVLAKHPETALLVVGAGAFSESARRLAQELGISGHVFWAGVRHDVKALMRAASVFVLPSYTEGHPNVILEAGACGLPVVATAVGGIPEIVRDGESGFLVPARNAERLAQRIGDLLDDPGRAAAMGGRLQEFVDRHCRLSDTLDHHLALCGALLHRRVLSRRATA